MRLLAALLTGSLLLPFHIHAQETDNVTTDTEAAATGTEGTGETQETSTDEDEYIKWARAIWDSLTPQHGEIKLPNDVATLNVPENFYYLNQADAEKVLVEVWGNPPGQNTLGMLFPSEMTPFDDNSWGVTIEYEEEGYVSDADADETNYDDLLAQLIKDTNAANQERSELGYESVELIGWAAPPFYDKESHKLHWAKEIKFGNQEMNTLNYDIRVLGRKGVLILSFIANMDQKTQIESNLDTVLALAEFDDGSRYQDFNPDIDKVAAYGIGALIAGKLMVKAGIWAAALIFLKKFGILIVVGIGALFTKLFRRKKS